MEIKVSVEIGATNEVAAILRGFLALLPQVTAEAAPAEKAEAVKVEVEATPTAEAKTEEKIEFTLEDVREAMNRCRLRFEGEDFKDNTQSDGYKKYHKALTTWFKYLAGTSGASDSKPSSLTAEQRKGFIDDCDNTILGDDGNFQLSSPSKS